MAHCQAAESGGSQASVSPIPWACGHASLSTASAAGSGVVGDSTGDAGGAAGDTGGAAGACCALGTVAPVGPSTASGPAAV